MHRLVHLCGGLDVDAPHAGRGRERDRAADQRDLGAGGAKPILPELRLLMNRTGSSGSRVGPALMTTLSPASGPASSAANTARAISSASSMRPRPVSPQACSPLAGPSSRTPRAASVPAFACVAACAHIRRFIAGAAHTGASVARHSVLSRSSARPAASRARQSALAGAISTSSAQRASSMWPIAASAASSQSSVRTGRPDSAWKVSGVTKRRAPALITTCTSAPCSRSWRTSSAALYAAMPPVTPSRIRRGADWDVTSAIARLSTGSDRHSKT
jgi:hypothetical protein